LTGIDEENDIDFPSLMMFGYDNAGVSVHTRSEYASLKCYGYGATRRMSQTTLGETKEVNSKTLFDEDAALVNAEEWLLQLDYSSNVPSEVQDYSRKKRDKVKDILIQLLPDVMDIKISPPTKDNLLPKVEFETYLGWSSVHKLSLGYKSMIA
jgi:hypothetical protein